MGILVLWDNVDQTAIRAEFESKWSWDELETAISEIDSMIGAVEHQVDVIIDLEGSAIPKDFMKAAKSLLANPQPRSNEGWRVVVGANKVMRGVYNTVKKTFSNKVEGRELLFAADLMDARARLRSLRPEQ